MIAPSVGCTTTNCHRPEYARALCTLHYHQARRAGTLDAQPRRKQRSPQRGCIVEGCRRPMHARNYCYSHYYVLLTAERFLGRRKREQRSA